MALPRLFVVMGSGETSPTMTKTHRELFARLDAAGGGSAAFWDTPVGFQENADDISAPAVKYFAESVGREVHVASLRRADADELDVASAVARVRQAAWVFTGPGSPTYALAQWQQSPVPELLREKLRTGGAVVMSSAAACTAGRRTVPVYEIYKVGADPFWAGGLDLLAETGLRGVVIPHFDNAEGGNHDTRYCYLGERRLQILEAELEPDELVLGVDEHTGAVFDLDAGTVTVTGNGRLTVRRNGETASFPSGVTIATAELARAGGGGAVWAAKGTVDGPGGSVEWGSAAGPGGPAAPSQEGDPVDALAAEVAKASAAFDEAVQGLDAPGAVRAALELDSSLVTWGRDTTNTAARFAATERGRAELRTMLVRLGDLAEAGTRDPRSMVGPFVEALVEMRRVARAEKRWADGDAIRDQLLAAGVEIRDTPNGTEWLLSDR